MPIEPAPSRPRSAFRPWMAVASVGLTAVVGVGVLIAQGSGARIVSDPSGRMSVEVVAPVEREVVPGGTMEVGELVDGYSHVAIAPVAEADAYDAGYQAAWVEPLEPMPNPTVTTWRSSGDATVSPTQAQPVSQPEPSGGDAYGFDDPTPDYAAERLARQQRLDRLQADQAARGQAGTPVGSPRLDRDSAFY